MKENKESPYIVVLGIAQDAGFPQAGCNKECCKKAWLDPQIRKSVSCIALVDPVSKKQWLFDATPDIKFQLNMLENISNINPLSGVFSNTCPYWSLYWLNAFWERSYGHKKSSCLCHG